MAFLTASMPLSIPTLEIWDGEFTSITSTQIVEFDGFRQAIYTGNFTFDASGIPFGTLTGFRETRGGSPFYAITGLSVNANAVYNALENQSDPEVVAALLLAGNDQINGSQDSDTLAGYAGNDVINGNGGNDNLDGGVGNDTLNGGGGSNRIEGGSGVDTVVLPYSYASVEQFVETGDGFILQTATQSDRISGVESFVFTDQTRSAANLLPIDPIVLNGSDADERLDGEGGNDTITGGGGNDTINGGDGVDNLQGGDGDDLIVGGTSTNDLRDLILGGAGADTIDGGFGNDELRGGAGDDVMEGGFGVDTVIGGEGNDVLTGSAFSDLVFGGDGDDFVNGGFGSDRINGGNGADRFFHIGVPGHGSDWIQDFDTSEGDVLVYGGQAGLGDFQVNFANTLNAGAPTVDEAFVIYRPSGQILWALIDGAAQDAINIRIGGDEFDLLA